ncbi:DUF2461 domain-containing protein [Pokkaliibacter sp. MBI-7]|uniref:DUF2461 domain-containing protein n=1 Tax=Pokkaliibacter sp. MBI-7 TaxID=3040600 RepID=UPI00244AB222|nr:DUF2461 domain-containing protein [Pokkaliibacter sp. MBI-7]MDH2432580.1 DUF2461 domain-containing protein [Pokkaliibacter sp. MBI-7]
MSAFTGFSPALFQFLQELRSNNNKDWFADNKERYQQQVQQPMVAMMTALQPGLQAISPHFRVIPKAHNGSMFRIYRDTRFGHDKTPYKTHAACQFRHAVGKDVHAPGYYLELAPEHVIIAAGIWLPPTPVLNQVRQHIVERADQWQSIKTDDTLAALFGGIEGEQLRGMPRGFSQEMPHQEDVRRKSFIVSATWLPEEAQQDYFFDELLRTYAAASPFMSFLCRALELPF